MSSSSDEGEPFQLRDDDEDSDDERPNKRRKTVRTLRGRSIGFVSSTAPPKDDAEQEEDEDDIDDERPTMGGFRSSFNIGEFSGQTEREDSPPPTMGEQQKPLPSGPSAFGVGGKIQTNSFAARMMAKQGYVAGQGLGKGGQGITAPIQAQKLQSRAGLGAGGSAPEPQRRQPKEKGTSSKASTPGNSTPRIKAPPKTKYTVAAIESRGLHVPDAMKSIIIDATGAENKHVTSLSGFSTPTREQSPAIEASKAAARVKMQVQAYAEAWDATKEQETRLDLEDTQLNAALILHDEEAQKYQALISAFERVSADDSSQPRKWDDFVNRLVTIQTEYYDHIPELDLPTLAVSCLEAPFRSLLVEWDPLRKPAPDNVISSLQAISSLLSIPKFTTSTHPRKRTTPFESLLLLHWYPTILTALKDWSVYDPDSASALISTWQSLLPPWLLYKLLSEVIIPKLLEATRRFPKTIEHSNGSITPSRQRKPAPELHTWLFDWWTLLSSPDLELERFPELRSLVKTKLTTSTWPIWKPLLGSDKRTITSTQTSSNKTPHVKSAPSTPAAAAAQIEEISFKDLVLEWCTENDLLLRSTNRSDEFGRLLYRLSDAEKRSGKNGVLVYLLDDVVFTVEGEPFGLGEGLVEKARS